MSEELEDLITEAITDSTWRGYTARHGARAVVRVLQEEGYIGPVNGDLATIAWLDGAHRGKTEAARWQAIAEGLAGALEKIAPIHVENGPDFAEIFFSDGVQHSTQAMTMNPQDWLDLSEALATYTAAKEAK